MIGTDIIRTDPAQAMKPSTLLMTKTSRMFHWHSNAWHSRESRRKRGREQRARAAGESESECEKSERRLPGDGIMGARQRWTERERAGVYRVRRTCCGSMDGTQRSREMVRTQASLSSVMSTMAITGR